MSGSRGWVLGGLLSLAAWMVIACGNEDKVVDRGVDISRDAQAPDPKAQPDQKGQPDSAAVAPDAGVDSALPDRAAPDADPAPDAGSDTHDTDGFSVTVNPTSGTITENL
jgi:hypothetical protein